MGSKFKDWVDEAMHARQKTIILKKAIGGKVLPKFVQSLKNSNRVSSIVLRVAHIIEIHGRSHFLLAEKRKKKRRMEEEKENVLFDHDIEEKNNELSLEVDDLKQKLGEYKMMYKEALKHKETVEALIQKGVLNEDGEEKMEF